MLASQDMSTMGVGRGLQGTADRGQEYSGREELQHGRQDMSSQVCHIFDGRTPVCQSLWQQTLARSTLQSHRKCHFM